ncbi:MAG TPA: serine hydrolase [Ignavibacteria bacterium]|nr:serine hydrolase [Ignavibacteria bacterium]
MKKYFLILFIFLISVNNSYAQLSFDSLKVKISEIIRPYLDSTKTGAAIGVVFKYPGQNPVSYKFSFGHVKKDTNSPKIDSLTMFQLGSVTKSFTAMILARWIQNNQILLNNLAQIYMPQNVRLPVRVSGNDTLKMTILDLVTHYSALPDDPINPFNDSTTYQMMYNYLNNHILSRPPGECYLYSNLGVSTLGIALSHTGNKIIDSLFIQYVCDTLDMNDTRVKLNVNQTSRLAQAYNSNGDSIGYQKSSWPAFIAAGGLYSNISDMLKYLRFQMKLSPEIGMTNVLDSLHKKRRVANTLCTLTNAPGRIGMVWQMNPFQPSDSNFYFTWKDGGTPGFSSWIGFSQNPSNGFQAGVVGLGNHGSPIDSYINQILRHINQVSVNIKRTDEIIPDEFNLLQNYPNPFNPITKISFSIPSNEFVTLKVYDALGREISTLVNDNLIAGQYEINWNATSFASGVYFYSIKTENYFQTKKMLLVK